MYLIKMIPGETADLKVQGLVFTPTGRALCVHSALLQTVMGSAWEWKSKGLFWNSSAGSSEVWDCFLLQYLTVESQETCKPGLQSCNCPSSLKTCKKRLTRNSSPS